MSAEGIEHGDIVTGQVDHVCKHDTARSALTSPSSFLPSPETSSLSPHSCHNNTTTPTCSSGSDGDTAVTDSKSDTAPAPSPSPETSSSLPNRTAGTSEPSDICLLPEHDDGRHEETAGTNEPSDISLLPEHDDGKQEATTFLSPSHKTSSTTISEPRETCLLFDLDIAPFTLNTSIHYFCVKNWPCCCKENDGDNEDTPTLTSSSSPNRTFRPNEPRGIPQLQQNEAASSSSPIKEVIARMRAIEFQRNALDKKYKNRVRRNKKMQRLRNIDLKLIELHTEYKSPYWGRLGVGMKKNRELRLKVRELYNEYRELGELRGDMPSEGQEEPEWVWLDTKYDEVMGDSNFDVWCACSIEAEYRHLETIRKVENQARRHNRLKIKDDNFKFQWYDLLLGLFSILLYIADIGTDIWLAVTFYNSVDYGYCGVTMAFVASSYLMNIYYSYDYIKYQPSGPARIISMACMVLNLGPCVVTARYLYRGYKTWTNRYNEDCLTVNNANSCRLRLYEACLESAPQLVFQLYVLIVVKPELHGLEGTWRVVPLVLSWVSLALSVASDHRAQNNNRTPAKDYPPRTVKHLVLCLLWRLPETGGRVLAIALFTSVHKYYIIAVLGLHVVVMWVWRGKRWGRSLRDMVTAPWENRPVIAFSFAQSYVNIFTFRPFILGVHSRPQYIAFYILFYSENIIMILLFYFYTADQGHWIQTVGAVCCGVCGVLHIGMMLCYYRWCHPRNGTGWWEIQTCIHCNWETWGTEILTLSLVDT